MEIQIRRRPTKVPGHRSAVSGRLFVNVVLVKRDEDLISNEISVSKRLFQKFPKAAASKILSKIDTKFSPKEEKFIEGAIGMHSGIVRINNIHQIYVYIVIIDVDRDEKVTACAPMIFLKEPCEAINEEFKAFSGILMTQILDGESRFKQCLRKVHRTIHKYGDSMLYEEVNEDLEDCSICLEEHTFGFHTIRLPCDHLFCAKCIIRWLIRNGSCPLCRHRLSVKSTKLIQ